MPGWQRVTLSFLVVCVVALGFVVAGLYWPSGSTEAVIPQSAPVQVAPVRVDPLALILARPTLTQAIVYASGFMTDTFDAQDPGAALLAAWSARHLRWSDMNAIRMTSTGFVLKDSASERGRRLCGTGTLLRITADATPEGRFWTGQIITREADVLDFIMVGSSGSLVARSEASFCGIVTGRSVFTNAGGGTTEAIRIVGMFSLPENAIAVEGGAR
jgi:hypothetical protein